MTIETKISANGNVNIYVDGKRTSNEKAFVLAHDNGLPTYEATCLTYADNFISESFASPVSAYRWLVTKSNSNHNFNDGNQQITIGNSEVIYERAGDFVSVNNAELEAYILTLNNGDTAAIEAQIAEYAKTVKEESLKLDPEWQRQQAEIQAELERERAEAAERQAIWYAAKFYAAKIAVDSKPVEYNFRLAIYNFVGKPVQYALAESHDDDNRNVFNLLPTADELNDIDTAEVTDTVTAETDEVTMSEAEAAEEMAALESEAMDTHEKLDIKIIEGAPKAEIEELAEHIAALDRRYHELHKVKYGHDAEYSPSTAAEIIADAIELLTIVDSDGNEVKPPAAKMFTDTAEVDEPEVTEVTETERKIAEQVCDSMTAAAPEDWSVAFTENGKFAVYSSDSVNVVDTITAGDFLNPKEFFEQFRRKPTQAELDDPNVAALAELNHEREQLLTVRDELAREYPDEVERLKLLDEMIAETDADITALKTFKKPRDAVEFDDKGNVKAVWF